MLRVAAKYSKVFDTGLQNTFVYRWNFILRSLFALVPLAGTVFIWRALYAGHGGDISGYGFGEMIYYFMIILVVDNLVAPTDDEWQIAADIRDGQINSFLSKPVDYMTYRATLFLSSRLLYTLITIVPIAAVFLYFHSFVSLPVHAATWALTAVSLVLAAVIQFMIAFALAMLAFWILEISTVTFILFSFEYYLSGRLFPVDVMPHWLQGALKFLPFIYELYFPAAVFMEKVRGAELWSGLAIQTAWAVICFVVARMAWHAGVRRYESVGG